MVRGTGLRRVAAAAGVALALTGCAELTRWDPPDSSRGPSAPVSVPAATSAGPDVHVVQPGDTLFQIAFRHRLDWRDVAAWNRLGNADRIYPGQRLRLTPPAGAVAQSGTASRPPPAPARGQPPATQPAGRPAGPAASPSASPPHRSTAGPPAQWRWPVDGPTVWRFGESRRNPSGIGIGGTDGTEIRAAADGHVVYSGGGLIGYGQLIILKHNDSYLSAYGYNQALRVTEGDYVKSGQVIALMGRGPADRPLLHFEIRVDGKPVDPARFLPSR